jgi:hypothetical protein
MHIQRTARWLSLSIASLFFATAASGQTSAPCPSQTLSDPPRVVYRCASGVTIEVEQRTALEGFLGPILEGVRNIFVSDRAIMVDVEPGLGAFQIRTPYAIASVRGTTFIVDALTNSADVFVIEGLVSVSGGYAMGLVELSAGDGVSVTSTALSDVSQWPQTRVSALLRRFDR